MGAEANGQPGDHYFADPTQRIALLFRRVDFLDHALFRVGVKRAERGGIGRRVEIIRKYRRAHRVDAAEVHQMRTDGHPDLPKQHSANCARGDACSGFARRGAFQNVAGVIPIVLEDAGEIGMSWPNARHVALAQSVAVFVARRGIHNFCPVLPIAVANQHRDWRAKRLAGADARQELHAIGFDLHATAASITLLSSPQFMVKLFNINSYTLWHSFDD